MRIDPDACRDPDLLAEEVRRLRAVIDSGKPVLTDSEREAVEWAARQASLERDIAADAHSRGYKPEGGGDPAEWSKAHSERAATLRGLLERTT
jgi:hypothetical protein